MGTNLTQPGYVNNYDKNRFLEKISKAAVYFGESRGLRADGLISTCDHLKNRCIQSIRI